jgi:hypothetical protein
MQNQPSEANGLFGRIFSAIARMLGRLSLASRALSVIVWAIVIIAGAACIIALLAGIVAGILLIIRLFARDSRYARVSQKPIEIKKTLQPKRPSVESLIQAAEQFAAQGNYREAFRTIYLATILRLDDAKLLTHKHGITNWEYLQTLRQQASSQITDSFQSLTSMFDRLIYGMREVTQNDYIGSIEQFRRLEEML